MDVKIEEIGPCRKKVRIELPAEKVDEEYAKNYRELNESIVVPGFRRGKAPRRLMERKFGEQVTDQVKATLLTETLQEALEGHDLNPIAEPDFDIESLTVAPSSPLVLEFELEVKPDVDLGEYSGIEVSRHKVEVSEAEIQKAIEDVAQRHAEEITAGPDDVAARGDRLLVDLVSTHIHHHGDDVEAHEATDENLQIAVLTEDEEQTSAGKRYYPAASFVGKKRGDVVEGEFPEETHGDHSHPARPWKATIKEIKRFQVPEIDDEFAKELDCQSLDELRTKVGEEILERKTLDEDRAVEQRIVDALIASHTIELPESFLEHAITDARNRKRLLLMQVGMDEDEVDETLAESEESDAESVQNELRGSLILEQIAEVEGIQVTEDEVDARITRIAHRQRRWPNEVRSQLEEDGSIENLRRELQLEKTRRHLRNQAVVKEVDAPPPAGDASAGKKSEKSTKKSEAS